MMNIKMEELRKQNDLFRHDNKNTNDDKDRMQKKY